MRRFNASSPILVALVVLFLPVPAAAQEAPPTVETGGALFAAGNYADAAEVFRAITEAEPENGAAWFGLGRAQYETRRVDGAIAAYQKALELGFEPPRTMLHLARCHAATGDDGEALAWIEKAADTGAAIHQALEATAEFKRLESTPEFRQILERVKPCNTAAHRRLDFWVGAWRVVVGDGEGAQQVGSNSIQKILSGCAVIENWRSAGGGEGKSLFYYDDFEKTWKQVWVTDGGRLKEKHLVAVGGDGAVRFQGEIRQEDGTIVLDRTTLVPLEENKVRQVIEQSIDGGDTWQVGFDAFYLRD